MPVAGEQVFARDLLIGLSLDGYSEFDRDWAISFGPICHVGRVRANRICKPGCAPPTLRIKVVFEIHNAMLSESLNKYKRDAYYLFKHTALIKK